MIIRLNSMWDNSQHSATETLRAQSLNIYIFEVNLLVQDFLVEPNFKKYQRCTHAADSH